MKIGAVCQMTGLTDRTVRYYIEEGLLMPTYTKNYVGRKSFDFTDENVTLLQNISVLRKYGFSIPDIRTILTDPTQSSEITQQLIEAKKKTIHSEQMLLDTLLQLDKNRDYTVSELAEALDSPILASISTPEYAEPDGLFALFWIVCGMSIILVVFWIARTFIEWSETFLYIKFYPDPVLIGNYLLSTLLVLAPFIFMGVFQILDTRRVRRHPVLNISLKAIISVIYLSTWIPWFFITAFTITTPIYSETQDVAYYMQIGVVETNSEMVQLLFPEEVPSQALTTDGKLLPDTTRYYNITEVPWDPRYELFAQWQLSPEELEAEKVRVQEAFPHVRMYVEENEEWTCWVFSDYPEDSAYLLRAALEGQGPQEYDCYDCTCFAFRERDGLVRYISSYSFNNLRTPIFTQLDWS